MTQKLKNCPFCGSDDENLSCDGHYVQCNACNATGPSRYPLPDRNGCEMGWNTRCEPFGNSEELPEWLKTELIEKITTCELLAEELWDPSVGNGTIVDIEAALKLFRQANILRGVLSLKKPEE